MYVVSSSFKTSICQPVKESFSWRTEFDDILQVSRTHLHLEKLAVSPSNVKKEAKTPSNAGLFEAKRIYNLSSHTSVGDNLTPHIEDASSGDNVSIDSPEYVYIIAALQDHATLQYCFTQAGSQENDCTSPFLQVDKGVRLSRTSDMPNCILRLLHSEKLANLFGVDPWVHLKPWAICYPYTETPRVPNLSHEFQDNILMPQFSAMQINRHFSCLKIKDYKSLFG